MPRERRRLSKKAQESSAYWIMQWENDRPLTAELGYFDQKLAARRFDRMGHRHDIEKEGRCKAR